LALAAGLLAVGLLLAGCGDPGPSAEEQAREALERATGTGTSQTTTTLAPPTSTTGVPGAEFDVDTTSGELPEGWPENFPVPEDAPVMFSAVDEGVLSTTVRVDEKTAREVLDFYRDAIDDAGFDVIEDANGGITFDAGEYNGNVFVSRSQGLTTATLTVVPV